MSDPTQDQAIESQSLETNDQSQAPESQQQTGSPDPIDYRTLYLERVRQQTQMESELERLKQTPTQQPQQPQRPTITDDDIRERPADAIGNLVENRIREALAQQIAPISEMANAYRQQTAISQAEQAVFRDMPHLSVIQNDPAALNAVRQRAAAFGPPTKATYQEALFATIGQFAAANLLPQNQNTQPPQQQLSTPAPRTPGRAPTGSATPRLNEAEKTQMRKLKLDPAKPEHVTEFMELMADGDYVVR